MPFAVRCPRAARACVSRTRAAIRASAIITCASRLVDTSKQQCCHPPLRCTVPVYHRPVTARPYRTEDNCLYSVTYGTEWAYNVGMMVRDTWTLDADPFIVLELLFGYSMDVKYKYFAAGIFGFDSHNFSFFKQWKSSVEHPQQRIYLGLYPLYTHRDNTYNCYQSEHDWSGDSNNGTLMPFSNWTALHGVEIGFVGGAALQSGDCYQRTSSTTINTMGRYVPYEKPTDDRSLLACYTSEAVIMSDMESMATLTESTPLTGSGSLPRKPSLLKTSSVRVQINHTLLSEAA
ncbi:hypothetical protein ABZP36_011625 [Zizania latifolia]